MFLAGGCGIPSLNGNSDTSMVAGSSTAAASSGDPSPDIPSSDSAQPGSTSLEEAPENASSETTTGETTTGASAVCDIFEQDCPQGEKCAPYAAEGVTEWTGAKCMPLDPAPRQPGEACSVTGHAYSGRDNCDVGDLCWTANAETLEGICISLCIGSSDSPACEDPETVCRTCSGESCLPICRQRCHPIEQDCPESQGCYPDNGGYFCSPDKSGPDGQAGDLCNSFDSCDPGLLCVPSDRVPGCPGGNWCCTSFCDTSTPSCIEGQECFPLSSPDPSDEWVNVGWCSTPAG